MCVCVCVWFVCCWCACVHAAVPLQFLLARGGKVNKAVAMVKEYLVWRRKHTPDFPISFHPSTIPNELAANKAFIHPPTKAGNPVGVVLARRHFKNKNKGEAERFIVYTMDQVRRHIHAVCCSAPAL